MFRVLSHRRILTHGERDDGNDDVCMFPYVYDIDMYVSFVCMPRMYDTYVCYVCMYLYDVFVYMYVCMMRM